MLNPQGHLFTVAPESTAADITEQASLVITRRAGQPLTKAQKTFNRMVAKVESLRTKLDQETQRLDDALVYFGKELAPRFQRRLALRKDIVRALEPFGRHRLKAKGDRRTLREILSSQLDAIILEGGPLAEADLQELFQKIHGVTWEQAQQKDAEDARSRIEGMLDDFGINVDLTGLRPDMTEEEFAAEKAKLDHAFAQQWQDNEFQTDDRPRSKRQIKQEERMRQAEEARKRSIGSIYKQLARALHPDLEPDPALRERKSTLMQELTAAYRNNDLHTLLRLELQWIEREEGNLDRMTDEKLAIYNSVLKEQATELEMEIEELPYRPKYQPLIESDGPFEIRVRTNNPDQARQLDAMIAEMQTTLDDLRKETGINTVRQLIAHWRSEARAERQAERNLRRALQSMHGTPF